MKLTIIIPAFNRAPLLPFAIKSVLNQTFTDYELLILDDASTDNTREVMEPFLRDPRIRLITHSHNKGIAANRNYGVSIARGEYIAMLDSDDIWLSPDKIEKQISFLDTHPEYAYIGTYAQKIDEHGNPLPFTFQENISKLFLASTDTWMRRSFLFRNQIVQSSIVMRKSALEKLGSYDTSIPAWDDHELWLRLGTQYKFKNIPEYLTGYRYHSKNFTKESRDKGLQSTAMILQRYKNVYPGYYLGKIKYFLKKTFKRL